MAFRRAETARASADTYGMEHNFDGYEDLMNFAGVYAVYIALSHRYHAPYAEMFLRAGKAQSDAVTLTRSMSVLKLMDEIRSQLGLMYKN